MPVSVNESIGFVNGPNKLGRNINDKIRMTPIIKPQNMNGAAMRGRRLPRNDLMSQTRPNDNAPDSIKNMSTPILLAPRKQFIVYEIVGAETNSLHAIPLVIVNT